jgi:hypothetical protein
MEIPIMACVVHFEADNIMELDALMHRFMKAASPAASPAAAPINTNPAAGSAEIGDGFGVGEQDEEQQQAEEIKPTRKPRKPRAEKAAEDKVQESKDQVADKPAPAAVVDEDALKAARDGLRQRFAKLMELKLAPEEVKNLILTPLGAKLIPDLTLDQLAKATATADAEIDKRSKKTGDVFG